MHTVGDHRLGHKNSEDWDTTFLNFLLAILFEALSLFYVPKSNVIVNFLDAKFMRKVDVYTK